MLSALIIAVAAVTGAYLAWSKRTARSARWQATVTPLASIMGSGFLVSAPLLSGVGGKFAVVYMAGLLAVAYLLGSAIRFNIRYFEPIETDGHGSVQNVAFLSRIALTGAYFISVTYYLQLLAAFLLNAFGVDDPQLAHWICSALLVSIGGLGMWHGLGVLERLEKYVVAFNLGMIVALLVGLAIYNGLLLESGHWALPNLPAKLDLTDLRIVLGLLIVVQGFETSRYLGAEHPADIRIPTMRSAQLISSAIYLLFIGLATVLFAPGLGSDVTAIITMTAPVAAILPLLLSIVAMGSQFSAAAADTAGAGGLIEEISHRDLPDRYGFALILFVTLGITWETDVNQIIAYASRAFALYYMFQCIVAALVAWRTNGLAWRRAWLVLFALSALVSLAVFGLGVPAE